MYTFRNADANSIKSKSLRLFRLQGYNVKQKIEKIYVESDLITSAGIIFRQNGLDVDVYRFSSATVLAWVLMILGIFTTGILTLIVAIISEVKTRTFAKDEILPLIKGETKPISSDRICPNCGRAIPFDAKVCPYCGNKFREYL